MHTKGVLVVLFASLLVAYASPSPPTPSSNFSPLPQTVGVTPNCSAGQAGTITVAGRGQAAATADVAKISLNIAVTDTTAEGARKIAAVYVKNVTDNVQAINGVAPGNVTTTSVSLYPKTNYNSSAGTSATVGYTYTNYLSVLLGNLSSGSLLSQVLDTAVRSGGDNLTISYIDFSLSPGLAYNSTVKARRQASQDATNTARQYAEGLGVTLGGVLVINDESYSSTPYTSSSSSSPAATTNRGTSSDASDSTPVTIGEQTVDASISVTWTICNRAT